MYQVSVDKDKNRLFVQMKGFLQDEEVKKFTDETDRAMETLKPNFDVINDISEFRPASHNASEYIKQMQAYAVELKVGRIVRVVGNVIGKAQLDRTSKEVGYTAVSVSTLDEATSYLDHNKN